MNRPLGVSIIITILLCTVVITGSDTDADDTCIQVTDGVGNTITLDDVPENVIAIGKGVNATLIRLGLADRIVVCDNYSVNATDPELDILDTMKADGELLADGNIYTSGRAGLITNCIYAVDAFGFDRSSDVVIITGSEGYVQYVIEDLREHGFENIAVWYDITSFGDLAQYVETISILMTGDVSTQSEQMKSLPGSISDALGDTDRRDALCITYSGGDFKVNNAGSLAGSMIIAAGGNAFTVDGSKSSPTYSTSIPNMFADGAHADAVVFVDYQVMGNQDLLTRLMSQLPDTVTIVGLEPLWNNFDIESMDGVQAMAQSMYPEVFGMYIPDDADEGDDGALYYAAGMVVAVILVCMFYIAVTRRS